MNLQYLSESQKISSKSFDDLLKDMQKYSVTFSKQQKQELSKVLKQYQLDFNNTHLIRESTLQVIVQLNRLLKYHNTNFKTHLPVSIPQDQKFVLCKLDKYTQNRSQKSDMSDSKIILSVQQQFQQIINKLISNLQQAIKVQNDLSAVVIIQTNVERILNILDVQVEITQKQKPYKSGFQTIKLNETPITSQLNQFLGEQSHNRPIQCLVSRISLLLKTTLPNKQIEQVEKLFRQYHNIYQPNIAILEQMIMSILNDQETGSDYLKLFLQDSTIVSTWEKQCESHTIQNDRQPPDFSGSGEITSQILTTLMEEESSDDLLTEILTQAKITRGMKQITTKFTRKQVRK